MLMLPQYSPGSPLMPSRSVSHEKSTGLNFVPNVSIRPVPVTKMEALFWTAMSFAPALTVRVSLSTYRFPLKYFVPEMVRLPARKPLYGFAMEPSPSNWPDNGNTVSNDIQANRKLPFMPSL